MRSLQGVADSLLSHHVPLVGQGAVHDPPRRAPRLTRGSRALGTATSLHVSALVGGRRSRRVWHGGGRSPQDGRAQGGPRSPRVAAGHCGLGCGASTRRHQGAVYRTAPWVLPCGRRARAPWWRRSSRSPTHAAVTVLVLLMEADM